MGFEKLLCEWMPFQLHLFEKLSFVIGNWLSYLCIVWRIKPEIKISRKQIKYEKKKKVSNKKYHISQACDLPFVSVVL